MLVSFGLVFTLSIFTQAARALGHFPNKQIKPRSIENCPSLNSSSIVYETSFFNVTTNATLVQEYLQKEEETQYVKLFVLKYVYCDLFVCFAERVSTYSEYHSCGTL